MRGTVQEIGTVTLLEDPSWFAERFDAGAAAFSLVQTQRAALSSQVFLDQRWDRKSAPRRTAKTDDLLPLLTQAPPRLNFIWHTGFCCSTLLAKALDIPGQNLSLSEPQILVEVADAKRSRRLTNGLERVPELAFRLLGRRFAQHEAITVKPAPAANFLLSEAAEQTEGAMLLLYSDCRSFLISIAKMGEQGRAYARRAFLAILGDGHQQAGWPLQQLLAFSDLELAALVWHMQIAEFSRNWPRIAARARSLDCDAFLEEPRQALKQIGGLFALDLDDAHMDRIIGSLFQRNAKDPGSSLNAEDRRAQHRIVGEQIGPDLDRIVARSYQICGTPAAVPLPGSLLPIEKRYSP